jgi:hypothetical protein
MEMFNKVEFALGLFIFFCWGIWMVRNDVIFRNKNPVVRAGPEILGPRARRKLEAPWNIYVHLLSLVLVDAKLRA